MRRSYKGISINTSRNTHEKMAELIEKDQNSKIVDIPCGSGAFIQRLKDSDYKNILGIDINNILEIEHSDFIKGDMTQTLPLETKSVDVLLCIDGIEHISNQYGFVAEVNRVLKSGGKFIISTPNISSLRSRWKWLTTGHHHKCDTPLDENNPSPLHHINLISFQDIRYLLHTNGFIIDRIATNRIKFVSWLYMFFVPISYFLTSLIYKKEKQGTAALKKEIKRAMFSRPVLFGETLIVRAVKKS
jgi:SAM-dependent methyltransferase